MREKSALSAIEGYSRTVNDMNTLASEGSDFSEIKGKTAEQIAQLHPHRLQLSVATVIEETDTTKTLRLVSDNGPLPPFQAGQYINLFVEVEGTRTARPYAISSPPRERDHYDVTVKKVPGGFVADYLVDQVRPGDHISSTGPMGSFHYNPIFHGDKLVFLAGGSGVAPALSMIKDFASRDTAPGFHLIYGSRSTDDIIFRKQLQELEQAHDFLRVSEVISEPAPDYSGHTGFLTAELLCELVDDMEHTTFYLCGPSVMYDFCLAQLAALKVPQRRIRVEANGAPKNPALLESWPEGVDPETSVTVTVHGQGEFKATVGEPLLIGMERNGYTTENACRSGECSLCRVKVLSGEVFNPPEAKLRASDRKFGWCHSCVAFPVGDVEIQL